MSAETNPLIEKIKVLDLKPGNVIIFLHPGHLSATAYENIKSSVAEVLDINVNKILILEEGMDIKLVRTETLKAELEAQGE